MNKSRRNALKTMALIGGATAINPVWAGKTSKQQTNTPEKYNRNKAIPKKGVEFNESYLFPDETTGRMTRRLTSYRSFNQKPTYHIHTGFTKDDKHLVFCTWNPGEASALVRANIETGDCKVLDYAKEGETFTFANGNGLEIITEKNLAIIRCGQKLRVYDIFNGEIVFEKDSSKDGIFASAMATCDAKYLITVVNDINFDFKRDQKTTNPNNVLGYKMIRYNLKTGEKEELIRNTQLRAGHVITNPVHPNLVLFNQNSAPLFSHGGDYGKTPRDYVFNLDTGKINPITPQDPSKFTWHANWNYNGNHVYYHGPSGNMEKIKDYEKYGSPYKEGEDERHFIGVATRNGETVWEKQFPNLWYGHVSAHRQKDILIVDNLIAYQFLTAIHWREVDKFNIPRMEILAKHNSTFASGQQSRHPHAQMTSDGKFISYNAQFDNRSDVYVVQMK